MAYAQVFVGADLPLEKEEKPLPKTLGDGQMLVRITLATICGSDLHTLSGQRQEKTPCILGHEAVGRIVATGGKRETWKRGQRVTWSIADSCGDCVACLDFALPEKCHKLFKYGHATLEDGSGLNGCYASHIVIRGGTRVVKVPEDLSDAVVAPANCALATMVNATSDLPTPCNSALIQGSGLLGIYACALLHQRGIPRIYCMDQIPSRREYSEKFGGIPIEHVEQIYSREPNGVDLAIEVTGAPQILGEGVSALRVGGHYVFVGMVHPDSMLPITGEQIIRKCLRIRGVHNYGPQHLETAIKFLQQTQHYYPYEDLVRPPLSLTELPTAIKIAESKQFFRVAVKP
ncbi:MAG: zinc-binding dehydrogenase [Candidatus Latescibacterota bacterium]|nr:zinc-binding dehydrogenase [Candidatus Latescibacterota bacterium]